MVPLTAVNAVDVLIESGFKPSLWQNLAPKLRISNPESITKPSNSFCLEETIRQWLKSDLEASWKKLANHVSSIPSYGPRIKQTILKNAGVATL